jgi:uncharacterized membrane protein YeaQ/YmgE (transglycosylase-associated protein family)
MTLDTLPVESLVIWLVIGALAGWLAGSIVKGGGFGILGDIVVGIVGAFIGGWLLPQLGVHLGIGLVGVVASATIGAVVLLLVLRLVTRRA